MIAFLGGGLIWLGLILVFGGPALFVLAGVCVFLLAFALLAVAVERADRRLQRERDFDQAPLGHQRIGLGPGSVRTSAPARARERGWRG
jgi:UDP-N-acetylmuramyl pentapeptide phosphotransferase/UDP-N-acetylglucosamine-1-phosphate transferase